MSTPFSTIYDAFLSKITDYELAQYGQELAEKEMFSKLQFACSRFDLCEKLSSRDDELKIFTKTLNDREIDILAMFMLLAWISPRVNNIEILKMSMSTKDFMIYSQANHLQQLLVLQKNINKDCQYLMKRYSHKNIIR